MTAEAAKRGWSDFLKREPPVSTPERRVWLEVFIPERTVLPGDRKVFERGIRMGVYLGSGSFRLAGDHCATLEKVTHWRFLAGNRMPMTQKVSINGQTA